MLILYVSSTGDAWEMFMWAGMDVRGAGVAPERNDASPNSIFFIVWMIVGSFVSINLFVGAIVDNFVQRWGSPTHTAVGLSNPHSGGALQPTQRWGSPTHTAVGLSNPQTAAQPTHGRP